MIHIKRFSAAGELAFALATKTWQKKTNPNNAFALSRHTYRVAYYKPTSHIEGFIHHILCHCC